MVVASILMFCFGRHMWILILARALQGAATSTLWISGMALVVDASEAENTGGALGWLNVAMVAGMLAGPSLGGLVYDRAGFYSVFVMAGAILFVDTVLRLFVIDPRSYENATAKSKGTNYGTLPSHEPPSDPEAPPARGAEHHRSKVDEHSGNQTRPSIRKRLIQKTPASWAVFRSSGFSMHVWAIVVVAFSQSALEAVRILHSIVSLAEGAECS